MAGFALAAAGGLALWQLAAWQPWAVRRVPPLWILYAGYAALGVGLLVAAAHAAGWVLRLAWPAHVIGVAGFSVLIIGMVTRTALGHSGARCAPTPAWWRHAGWSSRRQRFAFWPCCPPPSPPRRCMHRPRPGCSPSACISGASSR